MPVSYSRRMRSVPAPAGSPWMISSGDQAPEVVDRLLRDLPEWFGIESSIADYVTAARQLPTYLAWPALEENKDMWPGKPVPDHDQDAASAGA